MRGVQNVRRLRPEEINIAREVFKHTIPYDRVLITDAIGGEDRPFTLPTSLRISKIVKNAKTGKTIVLGLGMIPGLGVVGGLIVDQLTDPSVPNFDVDPSLGKYVMHVGDAYAGMSSDLAGKKLLIHELTHVWQGEHYPGSWDYVYKSLWHQALAELGDWDAYAYDETSLQEWDDYNPEQQASIVEHWFANGMKEAKTEDRRFYYIKKHIRGEQMDGNWIVDQWIPKPIERGTLKVSLQWWTKSDWDRWDSQVLPLLQQRFQPNDVAGFTGRVKKLAELFRQVPGYEVKGLLERLQKRNPTDKVSHFFHAHLATYERNQLLAILKKAAGIP